MSCRSTISVRRVLSQLRSSNTNENHTSVRVADNKPRFRCKSTTDTPVSRDIFSRMGQSRTDPAGEILNILVASQSPIEFASGTLS